MASTAPPPSQASPIGNGRKRWFLLGLCFAVGYSATQRLIQIQFSPGWSGHQRFEVKPFPGTELNTLRRKVGEAEMEIRGDLDLLELERQRKQESAAIEARREAMAERERQRQEEAERSPEPLPDPEPVPELQALPEPPDLPPPTAPDPGPLLPSTPATPPPPAARP
ncbi:MAG: hypothetical protein ACKOXO_12335 [Cyanobium sp.]